MAVGARVAQGAERVGRGMDDPMGPTGWRGLACALARLAHPDAPDPVSALAAFLDTPSFTIHVSDFTLVVPESLVIQTAGQRLEVHLVPRDAKLAPTVLFFHPVGDAEHSAADKTFRYRFEADDPDKKLTYIPGDKLYAELPLAGDKKLLWDEKRSQLYQFEALRHTRFCWTPTSRGRGWRRRG